ncbi:MAG: LuxR C-terminal-related transcriptional regulator [Actinomycetota bacterium]|nr:LuxR C-terminal-related transcriptional regulator [Actinomycetota bacterium]
MALAASTTQEPSLLEPTPDEVALLRLMARGFTDEVVAQKLGLTGRTLRRRLRSAMDKLGASSRFEAGFKLAESGWLERGGPNEPVSS